MAKCPTINSHARTDKGGSNVPQATYPEKYHTVEEAAELSGIFKWKLYRAIERRIIPHYTFINNRKLVRLSEIEVVITASRQGGDDE